MPNVQAPDGTVVNFPDTMAQDDIAAAMRQNFPPGASGHADPSFWADLKSGVHDAGTAFAQGAKAIGGVMSRNGMTTAGPAVTAAGDWLQNHTPDEAPGNAPGQQLSGAIKNGDWSSVPGYALHSAVRALPSVAPILAGGAIAGPVGAGVAAGAEALGPSAYARAQNNGRTEPTTADVAESLPNVAAQGVLGSVLPGGAAAKIANPLVRGLAKAGIEAAAGGGMDAASQLGTTLGTDKGASIDPYQTAGAALTQGAIGVARGIPAVAKASVKAGADQLMARTLTPPDTLEGNASVVRVVDAMDQARQTAVNTTGKLLPDNVLANNVKDASQQSLNNFAKTLQKSNLISDIQYSNLRDLINNEALRQNNTITAGTLGQVDALGISGDAKAKLKNLITDLNTASNQSFLKNGTGPGRILGNGLGQVAGVVGGAMSGGFAGAAVGAAGHTVAGKLGGMIGGAFDRGMGTNTAPIVLQAINARRALRGTNYDPSALVGGTGPLDAVRAAIEANTNVGAKQQAQTDLAEATRQSQEEFAAQQQQAAALKAKQLDAMSAQRDQQNAATDKAFTATAPDTSAIGDYLSGKLTDPSLMPVSSKSGMTTAQEIALNNQRLRNQAVQAKSNAQQSGVLSAADAASQKSAIDLAEASRQSEAEFAAQRQAADALKTKQLAVMEAQRQRQNMPTPTGSVAPNTSAIDDYLSGRLTDPSLLPQSRTATTAQEIALNNQRLANQAAAARQQTQQASLQQKAAGSGIDALAQAAIDKATRRNAVNLAMPDQTPSARPDVPPEAGAAATNGALKRAQALLKLGHGDAEADPVTGLPASPVPVNTPIPAPQAPAAPIAPPLPAFRPDTPASVASTLATDNMASGSPQMPAQAPVAAPAAHTPGTKYIASGDPRVTPEMAIKAAQMAEAAGHALPGITQSVMGPTYIQGALLKPIQPFARALADQALPLPDVANAAKVHRTYAVDVSEQARMNARGYQDKASTYALLHPDIGDAVIAIAQGFKTPSTKRAAAAEYIQAHPEAAGKFPDWLLNHGGKDT